MSEKAHKFIMLYTSIDELLRNKVHCSDPKEAFSHVINLAKDNHIITEKIFKELQVVGALRNAIIHDKTIIFPEDSVADPHDQIIDLMEGICTWLKKPLLVQNLRGPEPQVFNQDDLLSDCLRVMREKDFSQVVVKIDEKYCLFTREDEAKWFEQQADNDEIIIPLYKIQIQQVQNIDLKDQCEFINKKAPALHLVEIFRKNTRTRVAAVLVTENGKNTEAPLKIFTHWDLPEIIEKIDSY